jgi:hypothetical protein
MNDKEKAGQADEYAIGYDFCKLFVFHLFSIYLS